MDHSVAAIAWFGQDLLASYRRAHRAVVQAGVQIKGDASTLRGRLMQEMAAILAKVNRIRMIRDTTFVPLVYWMSNIGSVPLLAGLVMTEAMNLAESLFFLAVISFLLILLLQLIEDIDNPFGTSDVSSAEDVDISLLDDVVARFSADLPPLAGRP